MFAAKNINDLDQLKLLSDLLTRSPDLEHHAELEFKEAYVHPKVGFFNIRGQFREEKVYFKARNEAVNNERRERFLEKIEVSPEIALFLVVSQKEHNGRLENVPKIFPQLQATVLAGVMAVLTPHVALVHGANVLFHAGKSVKRVYDNMGAYDDVFEARSKSSANVLDNYKLKEEEGRYFLELGKVEIDYYLTGRHTVQERRTRTVNQVGLDQSVSFENILKQIEQKQSMDSREDISHSVDTSWIDLAESQGWAQKEADKGKGSPDQPQR